MERPCNRVVRAVDEQDERRVKCRCRCNYKSGKDEEHPLARSWHWGSATVAHELFVAGYRSSRDNSALKRRYPVGVFHENARVKILKTNPRSELKQVNKKQLRINGKLPTHV